MPLHLASYSSHNNRINLAGCHCTVSYPCNFCFHLISYFNFNYNCCLYFSKLKELSKRTTFIRVTQQINEVFGSTNEEKEEVSMPIELIGNVSQAADGNTDGGDSKRARGNK